MKKTEDLKIEGKLSAQTELISMDLTEMTKKMNGYATSILRYLDLKARRGLEPADFTQEVLLKVYDGTRDWQSAPTNSMESYLMMSVKSECSHFIEKISRSRAIMTEYDENVY